ncbi:MAG TPA: ATP-binding protein [Gemmatimonadaceae bacterium]|nr:ATP-binding protein [Gemmatimonadaceae bacterium]
MRGLVEPLAKDTGDPLRASPDVKIRTKLGLGLLTIVVVLLAPLLFALRSLERLHDTTRDLQRGEFAASLLLGRLRTSVEELRRAEDRVAIVRDTASRIAMERQVDTLRARTDSLRLLGLDSAGVAVAAVLASIENHARDEYAAAMNGRIEVLDSISNRHVRPALRDMETVIRTAEGSLRLRTADRVRDAADETGNAQRAAGFALAVALVLALGIAIGLWRSISRPVRDLEEGMAAVASGKFDHRIEVSTERRDEFGQLAKSYEVMAQQLAQLDQLRAEFISIASHELKTPINVIVGYLQLMEEGVYGPVTPRMREVLLTLENQTKMLARLAHQLLDVSRFEAGGGKLELRRFALAPFLDELEGTFRVLAMQRGVNFNILREEPLPDEVVWDQERMNEVLGNLLSNAFKFTGRGGSVELSIAHDSGTVQVAVRDSGAGIPPEQLPRIFEKFYQADNQGSATQGGTGLGLAIAKQIVVAHGGAISVDSTVGVGTTFTIALPVTAGGRISAQVPAESAGAMA